MSHYLKRRCDECGLLSDNEDVCVCDKEQTIDRLRAEVAVLTRERDTAEARLDQEMEAHRNADRMALTYMRERDEARAEAAALRDALREIADMLACDPPCEPTRVVCGCGKTERNWCAGCIAKRALDAAEAEPSGSHGPNPRSDCRRENCPICRTGLWAIARNAAEAEPPKDLDWHLEADETKL